MGKCIASIQVITLEFHTLASKKLAKMTLERLQAKSTTLLMVQGKKL